jgi:imidazolonepropionase-like amidohydrolase
MKQQELALAADPRFDIPPDHRGMVESLYATYEAAAPERQAELLQAYRNLETFARRFAEAGGKIHAGSDPNRIAPAYALHVELDLLVNAGLTPVQAVQAASLNVAQAWRKDGDFGSVEPGKVADVVIVRGDLTKDISLTQSVENIEAVFKDGRRVAGSR